MNRRRWTVARDTGLMPGHWIQWRTSTLLRGLLISVLLMCPPSECQYTCIGGDGIDADIGGSAINHQQSWEQGFHKGQTAPCSIQKTYTAYEDRDYGDGSRGNLLFGGTAGFSCNTGGRCTGQDQREPLHMLGTDSAGCCCSAGAIGLGLQVNTYAWTLADALRYPECDSQLQECAGGSCQVTKPCVPEVCQFEIISTPSKGSIYSMTDDGTIRDILSNCSESEPCIVPTRFNRAQPVTDNLVGADGRFETNQVIFRPWAGDVGECDPLTVAYCQRGLLRNAFIQQLRQEMWRYSSFQFRIRSLTWKYMTDTASLSKEFTKTLQESWVEKMEDAHQKLLSLNVNDVFVLEGCPCASEELGDGTVVYTCDGIVQDCTDGGTKGRILIIDLPRMRAVDAGWSEVCSCEPGTFVPGSERCSGQARGCYTASELAAWVTEVQEGCGTQSSTSRCFSQPCVNGCSGKSYEIRREQTGVSVPGTQWTRIVPYNDRPSVGGAGASLRFDGVDDFVAGPVDVFPSSAFTVMFWIKGLDPARPGQAVMQYISHSRGIQLQVYNTQDLEVFLLDSTSGPTGLNVNDLEWHHIALTWSKDSTYLADNKPQIAGFLRVYIDCSATLNTADPKASQASSPGGAAIYACKQAIDDQGFAWEGLMSSTQTLDPSGEISFGQRLACNASTRDIWQEYRRNVDLEFNESFCRRKLRDECDPAFNATPSPYIPGIFDPEGDCTKTALGLWLSGGNDTDFWEKTCVPNASDPYSTNRFGAVERQRAIDWMRSNEMDFLTSKDASRYAIPKLTQVQLLNKKACTCTSGCYNSRFAFLGHLDEVRVYNFSMTHREIAFRSPSTVRDGINCASVTLDVTGLGTQTRCSHMLDDIYKYGLTLYWPFDDPFALYGTSSGAGGLHTGILDLTTYEVASVDSNKVGNFNSGLKYAMHLGMGFNSSAPTRVPSTAPVFGAKLDFEYYPRGTTHLVEFKLFDHDTCLNTDDPISPFTDSYRTATCDNIECPDSHCELIRVQVRAASSGCNPVCLGNLFRGQVRDECLHPDSSAICTPSPECEGMLCFTVNDNGKLASNNFINRFYVYTGEWLDEGVDFIETGRISKVDCSILPGVCTVDSFGMSSSSTPQATGQLGSFTGYGVKMEQGDQVEYRNVLCHGNDRCDPRNGFPLAGRVITVDKAFSFIPTSESTYTIFKGKYRPVWLAYYQSDALGGGGFTSDLVQYEVVDTPGEAGTVFSEIVPVPSSQDLLLSTEINEDDPVEVANFNQPQMQGNIVIAPISAPLAMDYTVTVQEDLMAVVALEVILDEDSHARGFNLTVNGPGPSTSASGEMYHALEVHCGLVRSDANCSLLSGSQIVSADGKSLDPGHNLTENVTYCDDPTYVINDSLMSQLKRMHKHFESGLVQKICTVNENNTEIYNITGYNYTCLPPCTPTLYTYQVLAPGCQVNCTTRSLQGDTLRCDNTYGLYPDEYACNGGEYHGQHCLGINDVGTCFTLGGDRARCEPRDQHPGVGGPDLKNMLRKSDPAIMVHAVQFGDIYFVDWLHRGAKVVWNELAVDMAAGLGYTLILKYLLKNGCPWRDSAIQVARMRGRQDIVSYLNTLRPPVGVANPACGCSGFVLHAPPLGFGRCIPLNPLAAAECFYRCGLQPELDETCRDGESNYLADSATTSQGLASTINAPFLVLTESPSTARCSTGSARALVRGARIEYLDGNIDFEARTWKWSKLGYAKDDEICVTELVDVDLGTTATFCTVGARFDVGRNFEFLNYHVHDKKHRVLYFPPSGVSGPTGSFNYTISRLSESPKEDLGSPRFGEPIGARWGTVKIHIAPVDDYPVAQLPPNGFELEEDKVTVMTLRTSDVDTAQRHIRMFVTKFPAHGDLYQVAVGNRGLNRTWDPEFNLTAYNFPASMCKTSYPDCSSGNCDEPAGRCFYENETFIIGERILPYDETVRQKPTTILNTTAGGLVNLPPPFDDPERVAEERACLFTDRYTEQDNAGYWAGEVPCELRDLDNVPSSCRRCSTVASAVSALVAGAWSGQLRYAPIYVRRRSEGSALDAPNVPEQGGTCSLEEQCRLGGNTASQSTCIDWRTLRPDGGPSLTGEPALAYAELVNGTWREVPFSWNSYTNVTLFPCKGETDTQCARNIPYKWPGPFEPEGDFPFQNRTLTKYGDPIDEESFYTLCGRQGFYQVMMQYNTSVHMTGFDIDFDLAPDTFFRVLAKTDTYLPEYANKLREHLNTTLRDQDDENRTVKVTSFSRTTRMERQYRLTKCAGGEWREVWRGFAREGQQGDTEDTILQGPGGSSQKHLFRIHPSNFTTKQLLLESCGLMYRGSSNRAGGNPLQGLEHFHLVGTVGGLPAGYVRDQANRIAYVPHPNFNGEDSFSFVGIDDPNTCSDMACRASRNVGRNIAHLNVKNVNDEPIASFIEITGQPGAELVFELQGVDASPDSRSRGWQEWGVIGQGAGQGSRGGVGPLGMVGGYYESARDPLGSADNEPDAALRSSIASLPDRGTLKIVLANSSWVRFVPPAGAGGRPLTEFTFNVTDAHGLTSKTNKVVLHYLCGSGEYIDQELRRCLPCPSGYFKPGSDGRTSCLGCAVGSAASAPGSSVCSECAPGTFANAPRSRSCTACYPGTFGDTAGAAYCSECPAGNFAPRSGATTCLQCGSLSYSPLPGMARCFDCPTLSRSGFLNSSDVANCRCIHGSFQKAIFEVNVYQLWSPTGWGLLNNTFVSHDVPRVENPWPPRLNLIGSNCTACPEGGFCHGIDLPPVAKIGYWTDWQDEDRKFWPDTVSPQFYRCDSRNVREVCLGYPLLDHQEQNELCKYNKVYGVCDSWPGFQYTKVPDPARCKAGYDGVMCSKCIGHKLKQCVPKQSSADDGWFYWKTFSRTRSMYSYFNMPIVDCYQIGVCDPEQDKDSCKAKEDTCKANSDWCKWETARYYRSFDGRCEQCPLDVGAGFFIYVAWFAVYGVVALAIVVLSMSDMASFSITFTFWQCAALLPRFQVPWPASAQSLLSIYTIANINLDALPWKCWLDSTPTYRDIWYLTIFGQAGLVGVSIVRWILPFLTVPPQGKALMRLFKTAVRRRNDLQGVGSVARVQYTGQATNAPRSRPMSGAKVASFPGSLQGSRPVSGASRDAGSRPGSGYERIRAQSKHSEDLIMEDVAEEEEKELINAAGFGSVGSGSSDLKGLVVIPEEARSGPRSKASLIPSPVPSPPKRREHEAHLPGMSEPPAETRASTPPRQQTLRIQGQSFGAGESEPKESAPAAGGFMSKAMASIHPRRLLFSSKKAEGAVNPTKEGHAAVQDPSATGAAAGIPIYPVEDPAAGVGSWRQASQGDMFAEGSVSSDPRPGSLRPTSGRPPRPASGRPASGQRLSRPSSSKLPSRPRSAVVTSTDHGPDNVFPEELQEASAVSRPMIHKTRPSSALSSSSTKTVSFAGSGSRSGSGGRRPVTPNRAIDLQQIENVRLTTPSRRDREAEGYREWSTENVFQSHTPRMEKRLPTARGSGIELVPRVGIAWYVRKQYFDLAWRHAVAVLTILYIMGANKCLEVFKWTMLTSKTGVLDAEPDVLLFGKMHSEVFPFALMIFPVFVCSPAIHFGFLYVGFKLRNLDDPGFSMRWGYLLDPFERKFWFWSLVVSARKFMFVFANIFLRRTQYMQNFVPALTVCINILLNYHFRPYRVERHNLLENMLLLGLLMFILLGLLSPLDIVLYHDANGQDLAGVYEVQTILGVMFIQFVTLVSSFICMYVDIVDAQLTPTPLIKWIYRVIALPLKVIMFVLKGLFRLLFYIGWNIMKRVRPEQASLQESKDRGQKVVNFRTVNRQSGDPPQITGGRYTDILYGFMQTLKGDKGNLAKEAVKDDVELVHPDDGAKWLRDKFAIRKRIYVLERRVQNEAMFDPRSVRILRAERQLTVALDAALAQAKRERDALFDQLYDAQTTFEAISADHQAAKAVLDKETEKCDKIMDRTMLLQAKLDATIRRAGQPESWKTLFLEQEAKRMALAQEIVDLQAQAYEIQLAKEKDEEEDSNDEDEEAGMDY